jgi:GNAT superfamily N-acetyltransferase
VNVTVHRTVEADWERVRDIRLEMLADTPLAYLETLATALAHNETEWRSRAARGSAPHNARFVAVEESGRWVGTMGGMVSRTGEPTLIGVYVAPDVRGDAAGVTDALLTAVEDWARAEGGEHLLLFVHEDNARARAAYERRGFTYTGATEPYSLDPSALELGMSRPL